MSLSPQWLDELRARLTLSAVVGRTTRLTKAGREFRACCPFHNEKSPSFYVNDEKGFYHCFGCGAHGDAISWMTAQRGLTFLDAVKELAAEAGIEVPAPDPRAAQAAQAQVGLYEVMAAAQAWFVEQLAGAEGAKARAYLATRGFDAHTCSRFGFGYAPEGRQALKAALAQFPEAMLVEAGLRIVVEEADGNRREPYDRFRGRLMLPIEDARGRVIAFGGRILDKAKSDAPKYLNSPDTPLFDKGRTLYNLHRAGPIARQSGRLVVVEGYMDVIALAAAGFGECVAPLGTALTERQIEMLWRLVETPVLCFDGDAAGQRAAMRAITRALPLLRPAHSLGIVRLPAGLDPDDLLKAQGAPALEALLAAPASLLDTLWDHERDALPLPSPEAKAGLKARLQAHVETIADPDIKALYRRELMDRFSAFAFPRRDGGAGAGAGDGRFAPRFTPRNGPRGNSQAGAGRFGAPWARDIPPAHPLPETSALLGRPAGDAIRAARLAAVAWGLARFPGQIAAQAERLNALARIDATFDALLAHQEAGGALETGAIATILRSRRMATPEKLNQQGIGYSFLDGEISDAVALADLVEAITLLAARPALEAALAEGLRRYEAELTDEARLDHQRLRESLQALDKRELEMRGRFGLMADEQTASGNGEEPNCEELNGVPLNGGPLAGSDNTPGPQNTMAD